MNHTKPRAKVLFLTGHLPYPPVSGGRRREYELISRLCERFAFHLVVISKTPDDDVANAPALQDRCASITVFPAVAAPALDGSAALPALALRHWAPDVKEFVERRIAKAAIDVVHVEGFYLMHHVPEPLAIPLLLVEQNVEYTLWHQRMRLARGRRERRRNLTEYAITLQAEIDAWKRSTLCAAVTEDDRATMLAAVPNLDIRVIPDGADHVSTVGTSDSGAEEPSFFDGRPVVTFVANFGYRPNVDAAQYLVHRILPRVAAKVPSVRVLLVGNAPPREVRDLADDRVTVTGRVASVEPFLQASDVVVCPLREGGGIKVKVLEALRHGKALVTTSVGAQGIEQRGRAAMVVRDDARSFAAAVTKLLLDQGERRALERIAAEFAASLPTWEDSAVELERCYDELRGRAGKVLLDLESSPAP